MEKGVRVVIKNIVKKLNDENLIKIIEEFKFIIINTNKQMKQWMKKKIGIYYDRFKPFNQ